VVVVGTWEKKQTHACDKGFHSVAFFNSWHINLIKWLSGAPPLIKSSRFHSQNHYSYHISYRIHQLFRLTMNHRHKEVRGRPWTLSVVPHFLFCRWPEASEVRKIGTFLWFVHQKKGNPGTCQLWTTNLRIRVTNSGTMNKVVVIHSCSVLRSRKEATLQQQE